ncbi:hypothetical protein J2S66_000895 [Saccharothrix longispora]|uniref:Trehalase-like N-terminal domain-containing protein n=3 Tax=Saccharothrix longispora TaxID=33920 RepID=A0ABU1PPK8_9PSEU|nr:hypothetical protein [Saccharothrix longispora]
MVLRSPGMNWQTTFDSRQETATAVVRPREGVVILLELHCGATDLSEATSGGPERRARAHRSNWTATLRCFYDCQVVLGRGWVAVRRRKSSRLM